jgi:hypothetical protein
MITLKDMTQQEKVLEKFNRDNEVDNFWAIENKILRLGSIMCDLKKKGTNFTTMFGKERGFERNLWKNFYYIKVQPKKVFNAFSLEMIEKKKQDARLQKLI